MKKETFIMCMTFTKKRILTFALALALIFTLAACSGDGEDGEDAIRAAFMTDYAFVPSYFELEEDANQGEVRSMVHGERLYYFFAPWDMPDEDTDWETWEPSPRIVIASVAADGTAPERLEIPMPDASMLEVVGLKITDEGHYALLYTDTVWDMMSSSVVLIYAVYDREGNELFSQEIEGVVPEGGAWFRVNQALFTDNHIVLLTQGMGMGAAGAGIYILDENRTLVGRLDADFPRSLVRTEDGRVLVLDMDNIREIYLENGTWGETFPLSVPVPEGLLPAGDGDDFDVIIDDGIHLIGYDLTSGAQTLLLNWIESGVVAERGYHVNIFEDGRIAVLTGGGMGFVTRGMGQQSAELIVLSRTPRSALPVREIITLGGFNISADVRSQVVAFNRNSQTHQMQVTDYRMYSTNEDPGAGLVRFRAELAAGGGPDIIVGDPQILGTAIERGFLADIYPFLDADPELQRSDFFQNILRAKEAPDGTLPLIANSFSLQTMVGMRENVAHIQSWTLAAMLELIEQATDENMQYILGEWLTGESFLATILLFGEDFINWSEGQVNLENEEFINLLEIVRRLPEGQNFGGGTSGRFIVTEHVTAYERMLEGQQLLDKTYFWRPFDLLVYTATVGDVIALGVPTPEGGAHLINISDGLGINAASAHQDEAWNFIRHFLLPEAAGGSALPLRIDLYEEIVAEAMRPQIVIGEDGEEIEQQIGMIAFGNGLMVPLYAMTEEEASALRTIVESADLMGRFDETVMEMVSEELLPFLAGDRSAADTARILNNRIQTYLNEQR